MSRYLLGGFLAFTFCWVSFAQVQIQFQPPGGGGGFPGGPPGGGFPGGPPGGGFQGGGGFGGGGGGGFGRGDRGSGGGMGRGGFDPGMIFDRMAGGKASIDVNTYQSPWDPQAGQKMRDFLSKKGISNGQMTKDLFGEYMKEQMAARMAGGGGRGDRGERGGPGGGPQMMMFNAGAPGAGGAPGFGGAPGMMAPQANPEEMAREKFKQFDKNSDGILQGDEQPDFIKNELVKFDANKNSQIEFDEYKEFFKTQMTAMMNQGQGPGGVFAPPPFEDDLEKRPTMFRTGKLPKDMPEWFEKLDKDKDGQVGLYEWKADDRTLDDFRNLDFNGDGFITIDECLRNNRIIAKKAGVALPSGSDSGSAVSTTSKKGSWGDFFKGKGGDKGSREDSKGRSGRGDRPERPERTRKDG